MDNALVVSKLVILTFTTDLISFGDLEVTYCPTSEMLADYFTKL